MRTTCPLTLLYMEPYATICWNISESFRFSTFCILVFGLFLVSFSQFSLSFPDSYSGSSNTSIHVFTKCWLLKVASFFIFYLAFHSYYHRCFFHILITLYFCAEILSFEVTWLWLLAPPCGLTTSTWLRCPFAPGLAIFFCLLHQDESCSGTSLRAYFFPASHSDHEYLCTELPN